MTLILPNAMQFEQKVKSTFVGFRTSEMTLTSWLHAASNGIACSSTPHENKFGAFKCQSWLFIVFVVGVDFDIANKNITSTKKIRHQMFSLVSQHVIKACHVSPKLVSKVVYKNP